MYTFLLFFLSIHVTYLLYNLVSFIFNLNGKRNVFIIRGLPGSGKTSHIKEITQNLEKEDYQIISYKDFYSGDNPRDIPKAYTLCFREFMFLMQYSDVKNIFIDNPNIEMWEYDNYKVLAEIYDYNLEIDEIMCPDKTYLEYFLNRSKTKISHQNMESMWNRWEEDEEADGYEPYVEIDISENGDCLPYPKLTKEKLDSQLSEIRNLSQEPLDETGRGEIDSDGTSSDDDIPDLLNDDGSIVNLDFEEDIEKKNK